MRLPITLSAAFFGLAALVRASNVIDLDPDNFDQYVGGGKPALVEFFAPWCGHCKNLAPTYEQLADAIPSDKVVIAKTDADGVGRELGNRFGVKGFPTLKWFAAGSSEPVDYEGGRDLDSLLSFITEKSGVKSKVKPPPPAAAVQLDASNFGDVVDGTKNVLVAFTAPWCGHCKNMKPAYEKVAKAFSSESNCVVAQMDADAAQNKPLAAQYDVTSYPAIKFFAAGEDEPIPYTQGRSEDQFVEFLNDHCGTSRTALGILSDKAGKVLTLDTLANKFFTADIPSRAEIVNKARVALHEVQGTWNSTSDYYVKAMERMMEKGESWLTKEQARIARLLSSPSLAPTKLDELKIKANILSSFAATKAEDAYDAVKEKGEGVYGAAKDTAGAGLDGLDAFVQQMQAGAGKVGEKMKGEL